MAISPSEMKADLGLTLLRVRGDALDHLADHTPTEIIDMVIANTLRATELRYELTPREAMIDYKDCSLPMFYYELVNVDGN